MFCYIFYIKQIFKLKNLKNIIKYINKRKSKDTRYIR